MKVITTNMPQFKPTERPATVVNPTTSVSPTAPVDEFGLANPEQSGVAAVDGRATEVRIPTRTEVVETARRSLESAGTQTDNVVATIRRSILLFEECGATPLDLTFCLIHVSNILCEKKTPVSMAEIHLAEMAVKKHLRHSQAWFVSIFERINRSPYENVKRMYAAAYDIIKDSDFFQEVPVLESLAFQRSGETPGEHKTRLLTILRDLLFRNLRDQLWIVVDALNLRADKSVMRKFQEVLIEAARAGHTDAVRLAVTDVYVIPTYRYEREAQDQALRSFPDILAILSNPL